MKFDEVRKLVLRVFGDYYFSKGLHYPRYLMTQYQNEKINNTKFKYRFDVESVINYDIFEVNIVVDYTKNNFISTCSCADFKQNKKCEHIPAVLLNYGQEIFTKPKDEFDITNDFLNEMISNNKTTGIKEKVNIELELELYEKSCKFKLNIGLKKLYVLNTTRKLEDFIDSYRNNLTYTFGKAFTYNPSKYFFSDEDKDLLDYLFTYAEGFQSNYHYYEFDHFLLNERETQVLFDKLQNRQFTIKGYGYIDEICYKLPTSLTLSLDKNIYNLTIDDIKEYYFTGNYKYILYKHKLYIISNEYRNLFKTLGENKMDHLTFKKDNVDLFKNGFLKTIKDNININENITDIVLTTKPEGSLYFDIHYNKITCQIKLKYDSITIDYFANDERIIRDEEYENNIITDLLEMGFNIDKNNLAIEDIDDIGYFLTEGLLILKDKYEIFTSKKLNDINIFKNNTIKANFSIGMDGIMKYDFAIDNIDTSELNKIVESLKNKKKYYKLKNGNYISLEDEKLQEFGSFANDLGINDLNNGTIEIPKYRAFYIDSLKKNKYGWIETNNSFDNFINNFKKYQNVKLNLFNGDKKILRSYQVDGVKWLYTLYKCDLGGILADEMGLGKSIQTIYFIKEILKDKPNAKIIIICPTALVYNWVSEFDKFGSDLKYTAVAESKQKRKEVISNFDNYNIFITTYGLIRNDNDEYEDKNFELCIIDEAQSIKNYQAGMTKEVKKINAKTKIALTGTPLENSVLELWSIFDFIMPGYLNRVDRFKEKYGIKDVDEESLNKLSLLNYQIKPFILRRKKIDVIKDLPEKIENNIYLELPDMQKAVYLNELKKTKEEIEQLIATEGFRKARFKILTLLMKLRQICIDPSIIYDNYKHGSIKIEKLLETVRDYIADGHKILIFTNFKTVLNKVAKAFDKEKISYYVIHGDVKSKDRKDLVDKFNSDDTNCFILTLKSGGVGLNLTGADIVIHLDIWWNPQAENQATDRAHRIGQTKTVSVIKLIAKGTIEERILELQTKKKILSDNLIEGSDDSTIINNLTEEDMQNLLAYGDDDNNI